MRLFVAVDLPEGIRGELRSICRDVPTAKWTRPDQLHLTLRFIGEVGDAEFRRIEERLGAVEGNAFALSLAGVGRFPHRGAPRILWAGIDPVEPARELQARIERALQAAGIAAESRPFSPHLTIARLRDSRPTAADGFLARWRLFRTDPFLVSDFVLFSSTPEPTGAVHVRGRAYSLRREEPEDSSRRSA